MIMKFKLNVSGVTEEIGDCWECYHCHCLRDSRYAVKGISEDKLIDIIEEKWFWLKDVPEGVMPAKNFTLKRTQSYFITLKVQRIKCWKLI